MQTRCCIRTGRALSHCFAPRCFFIARWNHLHSYKRQKKVDSNMVIVEIAAVSRVRAIRWLSRKLPYVSTGYVLPEVWYHRCCNRKWNRSEFSSCAPPGGASDGWISACWNCIRRSDKWSSLFDGEPCVSENDSHADSEMSRGCTRISSSSCCWSRLPVILNEILQCWDSLPLLRQILLHFHDLKCFQVLFFLPQFS